jgi:hypothetical protein
VWRDDKHQLGFLITKSRRAKQRANDWQVAQKGELGEIPQQALIE